MAQQIGSQVGVWTKVVETVELEDTGDILMPLKRISVKYATKAIEFHKINKHELAKYYDEQSANVDRLINA